MKPTVKKNKKQQAIEEIEIDVFKRLQLYLGISQQQHHEMLFNSGIKYLECRNRNPEYIKAVIHKKWFWSWYKEQYFFLDAVFVAYGYKEHFERKNKTELMKHYVEMHEKIGFDSEINALLKSVETSTNTKTTNIKNLKNT